MESLTTEITRKDKFLTAFLPALNSTGWTPLSARLSAQSKAELENLDFPTSRTEAWKYTRTTRISNLDLKPGNADAQVNVEGAGIEADRLVFVNGHFREDLSSVIKEDGVLIANLRSASEWTERLGTNPSLDNGIFGQLNAAYATDGALVHVVRNKKAARPIELFFLTSGKELFSQPRNFFLAEEGAEAEIILHIDAQDCSQSVLNMVTEIQVERNASLVVNKIQTDGRGLYQVIEEAVDQKNDSRFDIRTYTSQSDWVRNNLSIRLDGSNCDTHLSGAYLLKGKEHVDNHTLVDHRLPHSESNELYKGLIDEQSTGVFNGKVFVRQDAQKTNAFQSNANIVLTEEATMNSKPELEIYADDVKCSHGSTTGQFDEDALFYLKARGLDENSAYRLLTSAFIGEVIEKISNEKLRSFVMRKMALGDYAHDNDE